MNKQNLIASARTVAHLVRAGSRTREDIGKELLIHIGKHNNDLRALREVTPHATLVSQTTLSSASRDRLAGVHFCVKDSIPVAGLSLSYGTPDSLLSHASHSAAIIEILQQEGAVCVGKANMAEYGRSYLTSNSIFGTTANPFNYKFNAGGSSGGDAASVAAGMAHFAVATDAGGSVRVPANACGLFGLLPTPGVVPEVGLLSCDDPIANLFRRVGFLTRELDDLELLFQIAARYVPEDPNSYHPLPMTPSRSTGKFLVIDHIGDMGLAPEVHDELRRVTSELTALGYTAVSQTPREFEHCLKPFAVLAGQAALIIDGKAAQKKYDSESQSGRTWKLISDEISAVLPPLTIDSLVSAWHSVQKLRRRILDTFEEVDFILSPVGATGTLKAKTLYKRIGGKTFSLYHIYQYSSVCNVCGLPALAFPTRRDKHNLPTGLQLIGPRFSELFLLNMVRRLGYTRSLAEWSLPLNECLKI